MEQNLRTLLFDALLVVAVVVAVFRSVRWLLARRATPVTQDRQQAIATLCSQRGMVPNPVNLSTIFPMVIAGRIPVFENSFASPDGSLWAADMWTPVEKDRWNSFSMVAFTVPDVNLPYVGVTCKGQSGHSPFAVGSHVELESTDFNNRFTIRALDRRSAVMLLDQGMMQWVLDCEHVSFEITGDRGQALVKRTSESDYQPGLMPGWHLRGHSDALHSNSRRAEPVELELLFKFVDGFGPRVSELVRTEFTATHTP